MMDARTASYLRFFTTDDLRGIWRSMPGGGADARTSLRDDVTTSRVELEAEIQRRVWRERFGNIVLLIGAGAAVVAAIEGAGGGIQGSGGGSMLSVLSLVVTILVAFVAPLVAWAVAQRQIQVTARETWMREFRQQAAEILKNAGLRPSEEPYVQEVYAAQRLAYNAMRLLIAERAPDYDDLLARLDIVASLSIAYEIREEFAVARCGGSAPRARGIAADPGVWRVLLANLGLR